MLDLGWTEILVVGVVALIVIGPRDLPVALHTFGKYIAKLKAMARDFQSGIDDIARQHELKELQEGINKYKSPEEAIEKYVSGLENQGAKPKAIEPPAEEPESENSIAGDAASKVKAPKVKDWSAEAAAIASPAAKSVGQGAGSEPELGLDQSAPLEEEPELPLGAASVQNNIDAASEPDVSAKSNAETAVVADSEPKPGQKTAS